MNIALFHVNLFVLHLLPPPSRSSGPHEPALDLPPSLARDTLRGLLRLVACGRGYFDTDAGVDRIRARLSCTISAIESVAASSAAAHELITENVSAASVSAGVDGIHADSSSSDVLEAAADLTAQVARAASVKMTALEGEAVAIEDALERAASIFAAAHDAASSADATPAALEVAIAGLESLLPALSSAGPLELGTVYLTPTGGSRLGLRLVAPRAFGADVVALAPLPRHTRADSSVRLTLAVVSRPADTDGWGDEEWSATLAHLASHTSVIAQMRMGKLPVFSEPSSTLPVTTSVDLASRSVAVSIKVLPETSLPDNNPGAVAAELMCLIRVCGRPPANCSAGVICVPLRRGGVSTPLVLRIGDSKDMMYPKPAVSSDGRIFVPVLDDLVCVWSADGEPLADIPAHGAGGLHCVAVDDDAGLLYLGGNRVVALDLHNPSAPPKWVSTIAAPAGEDGGIAPIPNLGVVIVVNYGAETAWALRASDGTILHSIDGVMKAIHICADPVSATLFSFTSGRDFPLRYRYMPGRGFETITGELPPVPFSGSNFHPAAWMPATSGLPPCLVVGTWGSSEVLVLGIPDCKLLQRLELVLDEDESTVHVQGLACDPSGCALVVCDNRSRVVTLPWPALRLRGSSA